MQNSHCKCVNASDDVNDNDDERTRKVLVIEPHNVLSPPGDALDRLVPGLKLVENFITVDEEDSILHKLDEKDAWIEEMSRRVQHFGFPFNYRNMMLDFSTDTPEFPEVVEVVAKRIEIGSNSPINWAVSTSLQHLNSATLDNSFLCKEHLLLSLSQVTANEYYANQGIAPHVDTSTCFGPLIFIVSCGSGTTMTFKKISSSGSTELSERKLNSQHLKQHVWLPRRSLLILCSDARYSWTHGIASRKFDKVNGSIVERKRRVSLTFRQALIPGEVPAKKLRASFIEENNVFKFYDEVAEHWHHTRGKRKVHWYRVKNFLNSIPKGSILADIGSGDGKYFGVNDEIISIGCDRSLNLLKVSQKRSNETFCCDAVKLPFRDNCFDASMCIAVMHHLCSVDRRVAVVRELMRITKNDGSILIQAWAMEQEESSKRQFIQQDVMVPWRLHKRFFPTQVTENIVKCRYEQRRLGNTDSNSSAEEYDSLQEGNISEHDLDFPKLKKFDDLTTEYRTECSNDLITYERYCHMYKNGELDHLCSSIPGCKIVDRGFDKSNWFVLIKKLNDPRIALGINDNELTFDVNLVISNLHNDPSYDVEDQLKRRQIKSTAISQPMPQITLRTLR